MLQRDHRFRTQVLQLMDACVVALSFGLAFVLRGNQKFSHLFLGMDAVSGDAFHKILWLYVVIFPVVPLVFESQGFYNRRMMGSRTMMLWSLLKGCFIVTIGLVLVIYIFHLIVPRGVMTIFGIISFGLVWLKEELLRWVLNSRLAKSQYLRRVIIAGAPTEIARLRRLLQSRAADSIEVAAEFNIAEAAPKQLIELLHEHSASGVLISARSERFIVIKTRIRALSA